ncbi:signal recognition particle subunit SRP68 [Kipferlia bialata]|uniref:Signal recognition particle subunit SRP68 n=1 Tax=Kipferlia bialata TaxID=797122 RepID=A0A9K3CYP4_9EUKA|nr:signal recognition particle subunit SRP68 [Kipferlia bialata]|eukprot:g6488.t1
MTEEHGVHFDLLTFIRSTRSQLGGTRDQSVYKKALTRQCATLRRQLGMSMSGSPEQLTEESVTSVTHFRLAALLAEREWAASRLAKAQMEAGDFRVRQDHIERLVSSLQRRAGSKAKSALTRADLIVASAGLVGSTQLQCQARVYASHLATMCTMEAENYMDGLIHASVGLGMLARCGTSQDSLQEYEGALQPALRHCGYMLQALESEEGRVLIEEEAQMRVDEIVGTELVERHGQVDSRTCTIECVCEGGDIVIPYTHCSKRLRTLLEAAPGQLMGSPGSALLPLPLPPVSQDMPAHRVQEVIPAPFSPLPLPLPAVQSHEAAVRGISAMLSTGVPAPLLGTAARLTSEASALRTVRGCQDLCCVCLDMLGHGTLRGRVTGGGLARLAMSGACRYRSSRPEAVLSCASAPSPDPETMLSLALVAYAAGVEDRRRTGDGSLLVRLAADLMERGLEAIGETAGDEPLSPIPLLSAWSSTLHALLRRVAPVIQGALAMHTSTPAPVPDVIDTADTEGAAALYGPMVYVAPRPVVFDVVEDFWPKP